MYKYIYINMEREKEKEREIQSPNFILSYYLLYLFLHLSYDGKLRRYSTIKQLSKT